MPEADEHERAISLLRVFAHSATAAQTAVALLDQQDPEAMTAIAAFFTHRAERCEYIGSVCEQPELLSRARVYRRYARACKESQDG